VQIVLLYLLADFIGGVFHWAEDTLGSVDAPVWGPVFVRPNLVHHDDPGVMIAIPWYINNIANVVGVLALLAVFWALGALTWQVCVLAFFTGWNQQVHRFSHCPTARRPAIVRWLQRMGVIQRPREHWKHHTEPHLSDYCVLTPWVNPLLDKTRFWRALERALVPVFGGPRRPDLVVKSWYPRRLAAQKAN
jgi:ubiquitin-conjugating enzyme E2 variant